MTGYAGQELLKILLEHPHVSVRYLGSRRLKAPAPIGELLPAFADRKKLRISPFNPQEAARRCGLLFLCLPNDEAMKLAPALLRKQELRVIDLSGDFRLRSATAFRKAVGFAHTSPSWLRQAVYGLPELHRQSIPGKRLVANPGCYPTATLLALAPLAEKKLLPADGVIVDAKSGVTGAGRSVKEELLFCEVNEDFRAYKVDKHQHRPEMEQELARLGGRKVSLTFVPHLAPLDRGLYVTAYVSFARKIGEKTLRDLYEQRYKQEPFVRVLPKGTWPQVKSVAGSNRCEIGLHLEPSGRRAVILSAIDNLGKGAAGQAVQNMNLLLDCPETTGLDGHPRGSGDRSSLS